MMSRDCLSSCGFRPSPFVTHRIIASSNVSGLMVFIRSRNVFAHGGRHMHLRHSRPRSAKDESLVRPLRNFESCRALHWWSRPAWTCENDAVPVARVDREPVADIASARWVMKSKYTSMQALTTISQLEDTELTILPRLLQQLCLHSLTGRSCPTCVHDRTAAGNCRPRCSFRTSTSLIFGAIAPNSTGPMVN